MAIQIPALLEFRSESGIHAIFGPGLEFPLAGAAEAIVQNTNTEQIGTLYTDIRDRLRSMTISIILDMGVAFKNGLSLAFRADIGRSNIWKKTGGALGTNITDLSLTLSRGHGPEPWCRNYLHPMSAYTTLSEAVNDLQRRGYTDELQVDGHCLMCTGKNAALDPAEFEIDEFHRFEGNSDPEDQSIVYAISSATHHLKGLLINAYGPDASSMTQEMVRKLATHMP